MQWQFVVHTALCDDNMPTSNDRSKHIYTAPYVLTESEPPYFLQLVVFRFFAIYKQ